ncbi:MAG: hypothetical protein PHW82_07555 [Bacteroidales bacterium]|nr:hypothetical protein [Bacteroidales bacterium]
MVIKQLIVGILLVTAVSLNAQVTRNMYGFKSGHVEYELTGTTTGTKSLWWDDYGAKSRTETNAVTVVKVFGMKNETKTNTVSVINGETYWSVNLDDKTGQEGSLTYMLGYTEVDDMTKAEKEQFANQMIDSLGGERLGTEKVLGCDCEIISMIGTKAWNCEGVVLKMEAEALGIVANETAISFEKNINISASKFEKIPGITYSNNDENMKMMQQLLEGEYEDEYEDEYDE